MKQVVEVNLTLIQDGRMIQQVVQRIPIDRPADVPDSLHDVCDAIWDALGELGLKPEATFPLEGVVPSEGD